MSDMTVAELAENREACERVMRAWYDHMGAGQPNTRTAYVVDAAQAALRALANPAPEFPDEPTDPAVRVVDDGGNEWARIGETWVSDYDRATWSALLTCGPLTIVTPDPTPAVRELRVGDRVLVSADCGSSLRGQPGVVVDLKWQSAGVKSGGVVSRVFKHDLALIEPGDPA